MTPLFGLTHNKTGSLYNHCRLPVFYWLADDATAELPDGVPNHWVWILS